MQHWLAWLENATFSQAMREQTWLYPLVEIVHILGFTVLVGAVVMFDLRVLGCAKALSVSGLARYLLLWGMAALVLIVPAGVAMFATQPGEFVGNRVFVLKLGLIVGAGANALAFHRGVYRSVQRWDVNLPAPGSAKCQALLSILLWVGVISCGRLLAYV